MQVEAEWLSAPGARAVMRMLTGAGHQAWFVGGCVRNAALGAGASDVDIATDARPERVMELARDAGLKPVPTGVAHGTVTVVADGVPYEVTTFRRDVETDGRRAVVAFSDDLEEDARRRDFTMNALYADAAGAVRDPVGGLPDLAARHLRFIGDPALRIREDYLRILRFFRFHAWYGDPDGGIDAEGLAACAELADGIDTLSRERVGAEMVKLLGAPDPAPALGAMGAAGVLLRVLPGADPVSVARLVHLEPNLRLTPDPMRRLAAAGGQGRDDLRLPKAELRRAGTTRAAALSDDPPAVLGYRHGAAAGADALAVRQALIGQPIPPGALATLEDGAGRTCPVTAADLMPDLSGPALGARLNRLESAWLASGFTLGRDALLALPDEDG
ncbi:CCA tRNA nucleotidyltransferase [Wenxinia saemankumensis]|uniref:Poly(A) polymerase n=1 Tax=Wenxinia saemankumensis TaxID=1447782 RepID=A0A1M6FV17_9RHOB|nr:CCA tRNA nucleotidyltransferase [Wenxinia saemankumensis]SHJ01523.1 poly(A) polymerase [Wenxinia saemankumensis]